MNQVQHNNAAEFYPVPTDADVAPEARKASLIIDDILDETSYVPPQTATSLIAQYYLQYENGAKPTENLSRFVTADRRGFRLNARVDQAPSLKQKAAFNRIREIARTEFPELYGSEAALADGIALASMTMTGKLYLFANMVHRFSVSLLKSMSLAVAAITLLMMLIFRSFTLGIVSLLSNVLPLLIPLGVMGLIGVPIDGPAVIVASIALGVCVDDTIHFFTKFTRARAKGADVEESIRQAFNQVGSALTSTTVILVAGFGVLMLSEFRPTKLIGQLAVVMIALAWVADFFVVPAVLAIVDRRKAPKVVANPEATPLAA